MGWFYDSRLLPTARARHLDGPDTDAPTARPIMSRSLTLLLGNVALALLVACAAAPPDAQPTQPGQATPTLTLPDGRTVPVIPDEFDYTGRGSVRWPDGREYAGEWLNGQPHGRGRERQADSSTYVGSWQSGARHGHGEAVMADGSRYVGGFRAGERWGVGTLTTPDGDRYEGEWRHDRQNGYGRSEGPPGLVYEGTWVAGLQ
jgi:hypothetical protein